MLELPLIAAFKVETMKLLMEEETMYGMGTCDI